MTTIQHRHNGFGTTTAQPKLLSEALESILQQLEASSEDDQVCLNCWSLWSEGACSCSVPRYWPIYHAIEKLRHMVSPPVATTWDPVQSLDQEV